MSEATPFRNALGRHLLAIETRDFDTFAATVDPNGVVVITADGKLIRDTPAFLQMHREWFAMPGWTLEAKPIEIYESGDIGVAVMHLEYREPPSTRSLSTLTLVFRRYGERWLMFQDQNTPQK
jgi:hypothetical protein